ncbi:MAG: acetylxylan esterase [Acidobacteria bacterium]|nr:acetylxylan esterase [Acidobacteriota bacterium]
MIVPLLFLSVAGVYAQSNPDQLLRWLDGIAQRQMDQREKAIAAVRTMEDARRRKELVRGRILQSLGGLPDYKGPLNAKITGRIEADGYVIEKVLYESLPGYFVTANLYRPSRPGRYPGVLFQAGHTQEGKAEPQRLAANLALKGFVSLAFDPVGQGEREQTYDPQLKAPAAGWSVNEHIHLGAQAGLIGEGLARYFLHDAIRSLDYLSTRPEVDPQRLAAAGCSGGGALTTFLGALDGRLKAVIPSCFPVSYRLLFSGANPHSEMTMPMQLALGLDTADFVELSAPTPWQLHATEEDYFTPPAAKMVHEEASRWFRLHGAEDRVELIIGPGGHGTPLMSREAMYRWLIRWLKDGQGDWHELPVKTYANHELLVTKTGRVEDLPGSRKLHQILLEALRARRKPGTLPELATELRRLGIESDGSAPKATVIEESTTNGLLRQRMSYESEPGIEIEATLFIPLGTGRKPAVLLLNGQLSQSLAERTARQGRVVLVMDPRRSTVVDTRRPFVGDWLSNTRADEIGVSLPARRAYDILRSVDLLCARSDVDSSSLRAAAQGVKGFWLLLAAAADKRIGGIWLDRAPYTFVEALENTLNTALSDAAIHGFLLRWDIGDLAKLIAPRRILWTDPANWMGRVVAPGPPFRNRWVLGDISEMSEMQDLEFAKEWLQ